MSIDLSWETLTSGPDGEALAERIRCFIHDKFQTVPLPRFIRSVNVHGFDFGNIPPALELKDVTDPLPDFYELDLDGDSDEEDADERDDGPLAVDVDADAAARRERGMQAVAAAGWERSRGRSSGLAPATVLRSEVASLDMGSPFLGTSTPGILGGPGRNYFPSHLGTGTHTPLAAVAGAHLSHGGWMTGSSSATVSAPGPAPPLAYHDRCRQQRRGSHSRQLSQSSISVDNQTPSPTPSPTMELYPPPLREKSSVSTLAATCASASRPPTRDPNPTAHDGADMTASDDGPTTSPLPPPPPPPQLPALGSRREPRVEDVQAVFRIRYAGDVRLNLTAEILLDYPMPSFVSIPIKLSITGLSFDGVGVLAHIRKRVHFCFLSTEDALMTVGPDDDTGEADGELAAASAPGSSAGPQKRPGRFAGLLQEVKVESEIGERDGGKQSLKNVGKVEKFVLEQVRRIFEEEFVYPSFWTFLV